MTEHGRIAWRWVWCWLSVLAAGCSQRTALPNVTAPQPATLLGYTRIPPTLTPVLRVLRTPSLAVTVARLTALRSTPQPLTLDPPNCYETPAGSLWCLGLIRNPLPIAMESVIIRIYLVAADGTAFAQGDTLIARRLLPPNESSPYGVLFETVPVGYAGPVAELLNATSVSVSAPSKWIALKVQSTQSTAPDSLYRITAQITNSAATSIQAVFTVVTLFDLKGRVIGFRQLDTTTPLKPGETLPLQLDVTAQVGSAARYEISADGETEAS